MKPTEYAVIILLCVSLPAPAQERQDTLRKVDLREVTVRSKAPATKTVGTLTTIRIAGSAFAGIGTAEEMLACLPGMVRTPSGIEVTGYGSPLYVVDGRETANIGELKALKSGDIKSVTIERAPGARYAANTKVVVSITTKRGLADFIYLDVSNFFQAKRKTCEYPSVSLKAKSGRLSTSLSYSYMRIGNLNKETYFRGISRPAGPYSIEQRRELELWRDNHTVNWAGLWQTGKRSSLGAYYYYSGDRSKSDDTGANTVTDNGTATGNQLAQRRDGSEATHSVSLIYKYAEGDRRLAISADYASDRGDGASGTRETWDATQRETLVNTATRQTYDVWTGKADYSFTLPWSVCARAGFRWAYVNSRTCTTTDDPAGLASPETSLRVTESTPQAYMDMTKQIGMLELTIGARYEYTLRKADTADKGRPAEEARQEFSTLYPNIKATYWLSDECFVYGQWTKFSRFPNFGQLNSGRTYRDAVTYKDGNTGLRTAFTDWYSAGANYKGFDLSVHYFHDKDAIRNYERLLQPGGNIVAVSSTNMPSRNMWRATLSYSRAIGPINLWAQGSLIYREGWIEVSGERTDRSGASVMAQGNASWKIGESMSLYTSYTLQGHHRDWHTTQRSVQDWTFGANASLLRRRLLLSLTISDILHTAHYNNLTNYYDGILSGTRGTNDMRGVSLRATYTIFDKKISVGADRGNRDILERM